MPKQFVVSGRITGANGQSFPGVVLRAFDKGLPSLGARAEQQLGAEAAADINGSYVISFSEEEFQRADTNGQHRQLPDLLIRAFDGETALGESMVNFSAAPETRIDLTVKIPERSEYEAIVLALASSLRGAPIAALTDEDISFLLGEKGIGESGLQQQSSLLGVTIDKDRLKLLRQSAQYAQHTKMAAEAFYAWGRVLGASLTLNDLSRSTEADLRQALSEAIDRRIVPSSLLAQVDALVRGAKRLGFVSYQATVQLLDRGTAQPLAGFRVQVFEVSQSDGNRQDLGSATTDRSGRFALHYAGPAVPSGTGAVLHFVLKVSDPKGRGLSELPLDFAAGFAGAIAVPVQVQTPEAARSPKISEVVAKSKLSLPSALSSFFAERNIATLADLGNHNGLAGRPDLPIDRAHPAAQALEAHLDLRRVSADVSVNAALIAKGYTSVAAIADASRASFMSTMHEALGYFNAARMHGVARAQTAFLDNVLTGLAAEQASGFPSDAALAQSTPFTATCSCEDCRSAISPALYLADLLSYAVENVVDPRSGLPIDADGLTALFHQPFADLSISCLAVTRKLRQVRLVIEILRDYLGPRPLANASRETVLQQAEQQYRLAAYQMLLTGIGTSYDEIHLARNASNDQRLALADRLGIDLSVSRPDELDRLLLDASATAGSPHALTERALEELFGLVDTTRDRLSDGAKFGDDASPQITRWNLVGTEWGRNTDPDGIICIDLSTPGPGLVNIQLFKDAARTQLVASSGPVDSTKSVVALPESSSDLSGSFQLTSPASSNAIFLSAVPNVLSWRLRHLRTIWAEEDRPRDAYDAAARPVLPSIDPDVIGPDDFRVPFAKANAGDPDRAFDLWLARRQVIDGSLAGLRSARETSGATGFTVILKQVLGDPLPDLDTLLHKLITGTSDEVKATTSAILQLGFTVDGFHRTMELRSKDQQAQIDPRIAVTDDEWTEVYSILTQLRKAKLFDQWRAEEEGNLDESRRIILGPQEFWISSREPTVGVWPVFPALGVPLIDPDQVTLKDLPEPVAGQKAIDLSQTRQAALATIKQQVQTEREAHGFDAMVRLALGSPPGAPLPPQDDLPTLRQELASDNPAVAAAARNAITNDLRLSVEAFTRLMAIRDKDSLPQAQKPTVDEYAEVYGILTTARKLKTEYPQWASEELAAFPDETPGGRELLAYWRVRKAALPMWRATTSARESWRQALLARSGPALIDPDLVFDLDLRDPVPGNAAYDLWQERRDAVGSRFDRITATAPAAAAFDGLAREFLGIGADALMALDDQRKLGVAIQPRLDQLGLSNAAFDALLRVKLLLDQGQQPLSTEWGDVAGILVQAFKQRQAALWRLREQARGVVLGPDLFVLVDQGADPTKPTPTLQRWRATPLARHAWQATLQSRTDEQRTATAGLAAACGATEGAALEPFRDALILASDAAGLDLVQKASWVTKRFLIDAKMSGGETTRVEQAIETLQGLLTALSIGPFRPSGFQMAAGSGIAAIAGAGRIHVFARGSDNALWHLSGDGDADWTDWASLGTIFSGDPTVCSSAPGRLDVFALRPDSNAPLRIDPHVWQRTFQNDVWSDWQPAGAALGAGLGGPGSVGVVSPAPGLIDLFASTMRIDGTGAIQHAHFENNVWSSWEIVPGSSGKLAPAAVSRGPGTLDLFACDESRAVWHVEFNGGWQIWEPLVGVDSRGVPSGCAVSSTAISVFVCGNDNRLHQNSFVEGAGWGGWRNWFGGLSSGPAAVSLSNARISVFAPFFDNELWLRRFVDGVPDPDWRPIIAAPALVMYASNFREIWKWLGSYATWRAAMLVFLYPESLLLPTLRPQGWQTPGFGTLRNTLAGSGGVTAEDACNAARTYADYFDDVTDIIIEATCQAPALLASGDGCCGTQDQAASLYLLFMFGRGGKTNRIYWSAHDPQATSQYYAQTFWTELVVPLGEAPDASQIHTIELIGATAFQPTSGRPCIALFSHIEIGGTHCIQLIKFDPATRAPAGRTVTLDKVAVPGVSFHAVLRMDDESKNFPPCLGIQRSDGSMVVGKLADDLSGWANGSPALFWTTPEFDEVISGRRDPLTLTQLRGVRGSGADAIDAVYDDSTVTQLCRSFDAAVPKPDNVSKLFGRGLAHGMICLPNHLNFGPSDADRAFFFFTRLASGEPRIVIELGGPLEGPSAELPGLPQIENLVPRGGYSLGSGPQEQQVEFVFESSDRGPEGRLKGRYRRCGFTQSGASSTDIGRLDLSYSEPVHPVTLERVLIPCDLRPDQLQAHRDAIERTFNTNFDAPASVITYLEEAFYFVPMHIALQLQRSGEYEAALEWFRTVYDFTAPAGEQRKIYYGLVQEEQLPDAYRRPDSWLSDPLNPHAIARTRRNNYTRYTVVAIIRCLLDYADSVFSRDTGEAIAYARTLYQTALDLMDSVVFSRIDDSCQTIAAASLAGLTETPGTAALVRQIGRSVLEITDLATLHEVTTQIRRAVGNESPLIERLAQARHTLARALAANSQPQRLGVFLHRSRASRYEFHRAASTHTAISPGLEQLGRHISDDLAQTLARTTNIAEDRVESALGDASWLRFIGTWQQAAGFSTSDLPIALSKAALIVDSPAKDYVPNPIGLWGCIPPNPELDRLRQHAELALMKLRSGCNIAGMKRDLEPYAAPTAIGQALPTIGAGGDLLLPGLVSIQPTLYRYRVLIDRAKQLVQLAAQIEASMLAAIEKRVSEEYDLRKARQDLGLAQAGAQLQQSRLTEAQDGTILATAQKHRAEIQLDHYASLLEDRGLKQQEQNVIDGLQSARNHFNTAQSMGAVGGGFGLLGAVAGGAAALVGAGVGAAIIGGIFGGASSALSTWASYNATQAQVDALSSQIASATMSLELTREEWGFQKALASQDLDIGSDQVKIASDNVDVARQELAIANLQLSNASDNVQFLSNKFNNIDLYDWMSRILEDVYRYFLQQASITGRLAQSQLAFERQEVPPSFIQADYWASPTSQAQSVSGAAAPDRRGLTGSERLLQDIYALDQYAFQTDQRKLQLSKTFSLSRLAPVEFQQFRETGTLIFATPMEMFDRDFPGHYLRLIKRIRTSVIALIPPPQGVQATLFCTGISRVVIGGSAFQMIPLRRAPQYVALTSPMNATGLFELDTQSDMLFPFENTGVDTSWEFSLPKAANTFDYSSIADVLLTMDYTALNSFDYRRQVMRALSTSVSADRAYSFLSDLPDQWYDLNNPDQTPRPMTVRFTTSRSDFPPNIDDIRIQQVLLYFSRAEGSTFEIPLSALQFTPQGQTTAIGGGATSIDGTISTRRGNAGSWIPLIGKSPFGEWELSLPATPEVRQRFSDSGIEDILFVLTYTGRAPEWAS
jgi:hypothetical protein